MKKLQTLKHIHREREMRLDLGGATKVIPGAPSRRVRITDVVRQILEPRPRSTHHSFQKLEHLFLLSIQVLFDGSIWNQNEERKLLFCFMILLLLLQAAAIISPLPVDLFLLFISSELWSDLDGVTLSPFSCFVFTVRAVYLFTRRRAVGSYMWTDRTSSWIGPLNVFASLFQSCISRLSND